MSVTEAAVAAAVVEAGWDWTAEPGIPTPAYCMFPILEAALPHIRAAIAAPVLVIHAPCHTTETKPWECKHGHADEFMVTGIPDVPAVCTECTDGNDDFLPYPCPTVRALGVTS